ncbi:hypothetical protein MIND_00947900 [Mycena indigotica]|uniref:Fe2OG dioxygenase domain-containing protein n=1 Tax=Mycena indigotica TaxID=2126181 RepID=A0A8H6VWZ4_9AGAR|nr:uncharacterized protein MIND_00947900 [Mycena indigotica]KAF7297149.1 hypothetical protein MIND_00947900 [Mycena indigotica]
MSADEDSVPASPDSLFDEPLISPASLTAPPIPGLFFSPSLLLPIELADRVFTFCSERYFKRPGVNQVMLFGEEMIPAPLLDLLSALSPFLRPALPHGVHELLFPAAPTMARQAIVNLYNPGEGISSHVDLLGRYADGIVGVSLGSACVMHFTRTSSTMGEEQTADVFLPERSVIVLSGEARYKWAHGIERRFEDVVNGENASVVSVPRGLRISVTFRWLLPGADVVGEHEP